MTSRIAAIVDYTAVVAARVQGVPLANGEVGGVRSVFGAGLGIYADPLRPGQTIQPAPAIPLEAFSHQTDLPGAPAPTPLTQDGVVQLEWEVPMRLYVPVTDFALVRQTLLPFYDAYYGAFWRDRTLAGLCLLAYIKSFNRGQENDWAYLDMPLYVLEEVSY